ncbi:hypothetical protein BDB00DRAFT_467011 [Zychaea mexicana]|uniref:uncharacterized protein n=1 Tax=Zychaea mexicana TaxID=64656 RepID=UPI0022FDD91E|nr:uncharacterized protein BDB00DRAFT_467011 [Zychaea mexicana]KAI9491839.1 hypothetical protein BDB00DRAFT_467011 [Zychaea mexicana]
MPSLSVVHVCLSPYSVCSIKPSIAVLALALSLSLFSFSHILHPFALTVVQATRHAAHFIFCPDRPAHSVLSCCATCFVLDS